MILTIGEFIVVQHGSGFILFLLAAIVFIDDIKNLNDPSFPAVHSRTCLNYTGNTAAQLVSYSKETINYKFF